MIEIAHIENDYTSKFGVPRQSGLTNAMPSRIIFSSQYRNPDALRGIDGFSHLWLLWRFDNPAKQSLTVRPPRLGGNRRMGVWATRSPFRPNNIGLSCVRLIRVDWHTSQGPILWVEDADLMNGTAIFDIKPYLPFTDSHPDATSGWCAQAEQAIHPLDVHISSEVQHRYPFTPDQWDTIRQILTQDPRPHYKDDNPLTTYSFEFASQTITFRVNDNKLELI